MNMQVTEREDRVCLIELSGNSTRGIRCRWAARFTESSTKTRGGWSWT